MNSEKVLAWLQYLQRAIEQAKTFPDIEAAYLRMLEEIEALEEQGWLLPYELPNLIHSTTDVFHKRQQAVMADLKRIHHPILQEPWLTRVREFTGELTHDHRECNCDHVFQGTGVFFQSAGVIQCASCKHWQVIRKPVK